MLTFEGLNFNIPQLGSGEVAEGWDGEDPLAQILRSQGPSTFVQKVRALVVVHPQRECCSCVANVLLMCC